MGVVSPDLEKQGFLAVVFVNREYSGQRDRSSFENEISAPDKIIVENSWP
jgi:hypothetical protein